MDRKELMARIAAVVVTLEETNGSPESMLYLLCNMDMSEYETLRNILLKAGLVTIKSNYITLTTEGKETARKLAAAVNREQQERAMQGVTVKFVDNEKGSPAGKLADAELHFAEGIFAGLKLIGFSVWERRTGGGRNVTFPARQFAVNGERRSFALLRPIAFTVGMTSGDQNRVRDLILTAYAAHEAALQETR